MIKLYGIPLSNYTCMVHLVLAEKGLDFETVEAGPSQQAALRSKSPMGKVPCIETGEGFLSETSAILEYLDELSSDPSLRPAEPFACAKMRELMKCIELYVELPARRHFGEVFFGGPRNDAAFEEVKPVMEKGAETLKQLGRFDPYLLGARFTLADAMLAFSVPYSNNVARAIYGWDLVDAVPGLAGTLDAIAARPRAKDVYAANQAAIAALVA